MQWFLALNEGGPAFRQYCDMAKVAIHTALACTSLRPHLIYDGSENDFTAWVRARGVPVIRWRTSLFSDLTDLGRRMQHPGFTAALPGIFLRIDLPVIGQRLGLDQRVLYTDCDVFFRRDVVDVLQPLAPKYFAASIESDRNLPDDMNSGVMWMHLPEMARRAEEFREFILRKMDELPEYWDQGIYQRFYRTAEGRPLWESLPLEMNWKPYWEENREARIIHFHGPKPYQRNYIDSHYPEIKYLSGGCYGALCDVWKELLNEANSSS
jgi:hypothetical protein